MIAFEIKTPRKPTPCKIFGIRNFVLMAAMAWGMISSPDCAGVKSRPTLVEELDAHVGDY